ncbi:MAG TPA: beta-L-arabinofuranosidase domain-containing protein [Parafilimonas sp.]|nr:beta-L-arabinofuranosidase domain-containing protein [Parafilimonas sp.]
MKLACLLSAALLIISKIFSQQQPIKYFTPVDFSHVVITDHFWKPKVDLVATKSLEACIYQTEIATPRIQNFINAAHHTGKFVGLVYDDSDVYKALEAMGYSLKNHPDTSIENTADRWINYIAAAQMPDGYIDTYYQLRDISKRWTEIGNHEDYNAGHLMEAAVAYYDATGKRKLLDVAIRLANHIDTTMRINNRQWFSGHEEIEIGLMKLYHVTGNENYEKLANWYLNQRGKHIYAYRSDEWVKPEYWQDVLPVKDQTQITGHAVRAMYLYSGAADVAAATGDTGYIHAMKNVWQDVVYHNMYLTGGIGSSGDNEGFTKDYDLPNREAYCETCASVGMVLWNERMTELTGDAKYIDVLERSLYNGALDGLSLSGDRFFYGNPLASNGDDERSAWFGTACCPANISRLVAGIGNYIYGVNDKSLWVNLFIGSNASTKINNTNVDVNMQTNYPWDGKVSLNISPEKPTSFDVYVRIPGWTQNDIVDGNLYFVSNNIQKQTPQFFVNGKAVDFKQQNGYAIISNKWKKGDVISFEYAMPVLEVNSKKEVLYDDDRIALQRGPIVYCVEGADNNKEAWNFTVNPSATMQPTDYKVLDEPVVAIQTTANVVQPSADGSSLQTTEKTITAIPYYTWCNRGKNQMQVWLPTKMKEIKVNY